MANIRRKGNIPFTMVPNILFEDHRISNIAKTVYAFMLSKPETWTYSTDQMRHALGQGLGDDRKPMGRHSMLKSMCELCEAGWIERRKIRGPNGEFEGWEYVVNAVPKHVEVACKTLPKSVVLEPQFDFEGSEPQSDLPTSVNQTPYKDMKVNNNLSPKSPPLAGKGTAPAAGSEDRDEGQERGQRRLQSVEPERQRPEPVRAPAEAVAEPPDERPEPRPGGSESPADGPDDDMLDRFDELWRTYPQDGTLSADKSEALSLFGGLAEKDQKTAIRTARQLRSAIKGKPLALHKWLGKGRWRNGEAEPVLTKPAKPMGPRVFVKADSPQWDAWAAYERSQGRIPRSITMHSAEHRADGWYFASAWPPGADRRAA